MIIVGLTGSIGMGKSTTAQLFAEEGVPVNDADQVVHDLYQGAAVQPIESVFPGVTSQGRVDRQRLADLLAQNPAKFPELEAIVHPMVRVKEQDFLKYHAEAGTDVVVLDIPLLFETGGADRVDVVIVVSCDPDIQRARVLARPGMTEEKFRMILGRQVPDVEKRGKADYVIDTGHGIEDARRQVRAILAELRQRKGITKDA